MINIQLSEIIRTAKFGPVELGWSKQEVIDVLGVPDGELNSDLKENGLDAIAYGWYEFTFEYNKLIMIHNKHILHFDRFTYDAEETHYNNEKFQVQTWFKNFNEDLKIENVRAYFESLNLKYKEEPFWDGIIWKAENGMEFFFSSAKAYHLEYEEWSKFSNEELNWQLNAFYILPKKE